MGTLSPAQRLVAGAVVTAYRRAAPWHRLSEVKIPKERGRPDIRPARLSGLALLLFCVAKRGDMLHRTNSPATRLQQPVAPRNKSSLQVWLYPDRRRQDPGVTLLWPP